VLRWRLLEFAFDLRLLAVDVATDVFDATAFDADDFDADDFDAFDATAFDANDFVVDDFAAVAFDADDFDADAFDAFDATVAFDVDALDAFDSTVAFDAVGAPLPARVILTRLVIGSLRWRLKVGVKMNHRCVDERKRMIR